jgi:hypothetical protein
MYLFMAIQVSSPSALLKSSEALALKKRALDVTILS